MSILKDERCALFKKLNHLYPFQVLEVFSNDQCDIDCTFMGFTEIYDNLAKIIPKHFTIVDLGCAYAPQAFYFRKHKRYIGVNLGEFKRFSFKNTKFWIGKIGEFIESEDYQKLDLDKTFAICSYVPPWHGDNIEITRANFRNVFTYYPSSRPLRIGFHKKPL